MWRVHFLIVVAMFILVSCNLVNEAPGVSPVVIATLPTSLTCDELISSAVETVEQMCASLGRNQACYGHAQVTTEFQSGSSAPFSVAGDIADLSAIRQISAAALDETTQVWGIAIVKAQADIPDTLAGQNVTFVLFGETTLDNLVPDIGAVVLSTGIGAVTCANAPPSAILVQSPDGTQVSLNINGAELTLGSTVYITAVQNAEMTIATIEGTAIVAALNATRIIQPGAQVRMPLGTDDGLHVVGPPSEPQPYDVSAIQRAPLVLLEREVQLPLPIAGPTVPPVGSPLATSTMPPATVTSQVTGTPGACAPRSDWTGTYTVQRGDTLSTIARRFNVSLQNMQQGNCITNPDLIRIGQELHVPEQAAVTATTQTLTTGVTPTATAANFRVDQTTLQPRQCTTIRWDVDNATAVYFEDQITEGHSSQEICPTETTVYTLMVVQPDGRQVPYTLTVQITTPPNVTEEVSS